MRSSSPPARPLLLSSGLLLAVAFALVPGCFAHDETITPATGGGGGGTGGGAPTVLERFAAEYCRPIAELLCDRAAGCGCDAISGFPADREACLAVSMSACGAPPGDTATFLDSGAYVVRFDLVTECVAVLAGQGDTCETRMNIVPSSCLRMIASSTPIGASCGYPICAEGDGFCSPIDGVCGPMPLAEGDACQGVCAGDLACVNGACAPMAGTGEPCDAAACRGLDLCIDGVCTPLPAEGEACSDMRPCGPRLRCQGAVCVAEAATCDTDPTVCGNGSTCLSRTRAVCMSGAAGSPCMWDGECSKQTYCAAGVCAALPGDGDPCALDVRCLPGLGCDPATTVCGALPGEGETCAWIFGGQVGCAGALGCVAATCAVMPAEGDPCTDDQRCGAGLGCDDTFTCVPAHAAGEPCLDHRVCAAGLFCDAVKSVCAPFVAKGEPCYDSVGCGPSGSCVPGASDGQWVCGAIPAAGDACYQNCPLTNPSCHDCVEGLVCGMETTPGPCASQVCMVLYTPE